MVFNISDLSMNRAIVIVEIKAKNTVSNVSVLLLLQCV